MGEKVEPKLVDRLMSDDDFPGPFSCNCENDCPGSAQCACIRDYETKRCRCICSDPIMLAQDQGKTIKSESLIDLQVKNTRLDALAIFLNKLTYDDLYVPAGSLKKQVSFSLEKVALSEALSKAGLVSLSGSKK